MNEEPFVRPFLARAPQPSAEPSANVDDVGVRPYYLTKGRTVSSDTRIGYETLLVATRNGANAAYRLGPEERNILAMAGGPISVAEISARLIIPIGVAKVLAADLASEGLLDLHAAPLAPNQDITLIARLIHGVRAL